MKGTLLFIYLAFIATSAQAGNIDYANPTSVATLEPFKIGQGVKHHKLVARGYSCAFNKETSENSGFDFYECTPQDASSPLRTMLVGAEGNSISFITLLFDKGDTSGVKVANTDAELDSSLGKWAKNSMDRNEDKIRFHWGLLSGSPTAYTTKLKDGHVFLRMLQTMRCGSNIITQAPQMNGLCR